MKHSALILVILALLFAFGGGIWLLRSDWGLGSRMQAELATPRVYAYRDWQSVGEQLNPGDIVHVRAAGEWLYTPGEYHGPEGHATYPAPDTYPLSGGHTPGGVLLARVGEQGRPLLVGRGRTFMAEEAGNLYFRINDDILSDNEGCVTVEIVIETPPPED